MGYEGPRLVLHAGRWRVQFRVCGKRFFRTLGVKTEEAARARFDAIVSNGLLPQLFTIPREWDVPTSKQVHRAWRRAKHAAPRRKLDFSLSLEEARALYRKQGGACAVSGIPFDATFKTKGNPRRPFHASLDRIDSAKGYSLENCRWVCVAVNQALGEWGEEILFQIATAIVVKHGRKGARVS